MDSGQCKMDNATPPLKSDAKVYNSKTLCKYFWFYLIRLQPILIDNALLVLFFTLIFHFSLNYHVDRKRQCLTANF